MKVKTKDNRKKSNYEKAVEQASQQNYEFAKSQLEKYKAKKALIEEADIKSLDIAISTGKGVKNKIKTIYGDSFIMSDLVRQAVLDDLDSMIKEYEAILAFAEKMKEK